MGELKEIIDMSGRSLLRLIALACILVVAVTLGCVVLSDLDGRTALVAALGVLVFFLAVAVLSTHGWLTRPGYPRRGKRAGTNADAGGDSEGTGRGG